MREKRIIMYMVLSVLAVLFHVSACGKATEGGADTKIHTKSEVSMETDSKEEKNAIDPTETEQIVKEQQAKDSANGEIKTSTVSSDSEIPESRADKATYIYKDVLDMYYQKISYGWDRTEDVSLIFFQGYPQTQTVSDVGYAFVDLDNNGIPELLVSTVQDAVDGMIYDLYSYAEDNVVHLASSMERDRYYLCEDNTIYNEGSGGAAVSSTRMYEMNADKCYLSLKEMVVYDSELNQENPWFYSTVECYNDYMGFDANCLTGIVQEEAFAIEAKYRKKSFDLTLFDTYVPQSDIVAKVELEKIFKKAVGDEQVCQFWCYDFDNNGMLEAFGITGDSADWELNNVKLYFIDCKQKVSCIDSIETLPGYGDIKTLSTNCVLLLADNIKFLSLGGIDGQKTFLYGVKNDIAYQPEVSGKHASFYKKSNGLYIGEPHEGGTKEQTYYYNFNSVTGEFEQAE